jgi:hypothetical protein
MAPLIAQIVLGAEPRFGAKRSPFVERQESGRSGKGGAASALVGEGCPGVAGVAQVGEGDTVLSVVKMNLAALAFVDCEPQREAIDPWGPKLGDSFHHTAFPMFHLPLEDIALLTRHQAEPLQKLGAIRQMLIGIVFFEEQLPSSRGPLRDSKRVFPRTIGDRRTERIGW